MKLTASKVKGLVSMWTAQNKITYMFDKLCSLQSSGFWGSPGLRVSPPSPPVRSNLTLLYPTLLINLLLSTTLLHSLFHPALLRTPFCFVQYSCFSSSCLSSLSPSSPLSCPLFLSSPPVLPSPLTYLILLFCFLKS